MSGAKWSEEIKRGREIIIINGISDVSGNSYKTYIKVNMWKLCKKSMLNVKELRETRLCFWFKKREKR